MGRRKRVQSHNGTWRKIEGVDKVVKEGEELARKQKEMEQTLNHMQSQMQRDRNKSAGEKRTLISRGEMSERTRMTS